MLLVSSLRLRRAPRVPVYRQHGCATDGNGEVRISLSSSAPGTQGTGSGTGERGCCASPLQWVCVWTRTFNTSTRFSCFGVGRPDPDEDSVVVFPRPCATCATIAAIGNSSTIDAPVAQTSIDFGDEHHAWWCPAPRAARGPRPSRRSRSPQVRPVRSEPPLSLTVVHRYRRRR